MLTTYLFAQPKLLFSGLGLALLGLFYGLTYTPDTAISLQPPPFMAQAAHAQANSPAAFLQTEAGMSAYVKTNEAIRLDLMKSAFTIIEDQTADYIIGSTSYDTHMYIHKDGWIVVYYFAADPIGKIIDVAGQTTTKLETVISQTATKGNLTYDAVKFYHFKYPNATKMKFIIKADGAFELTMPSSFTYYERSWSYRCVNNCTSWIIHLLLDGQSIGTTTGTNSKWGTITASQLQPDIVHTIKADLYPNIYGTRLTFILLYRDTP